MRPDRFRLLTKRGATIGVLAVVGATALLIAAGVVITAILMLVF